MTRRSAFASYADDERLYSAADPALTRRLDDGAGGAGPLSSLLSETHDGPARPAYLAPRTPPPARLPGAERDVPDRAPVLEARMVRRTPAERRARHHPSAPALVPGEDEDALDERPSVGAGDASPALGEPASAPPGETVDSAPPPAGTAAAGGDAASDAGDAEATGEGAGAAPAGRAEAAGPADGAGPAGLMAEGAVLREGAGAPSGTRIRRHGSPEEEAQQRARRARQMPIFLRLAKPAKEPQRLPAVFPSVPAPPDVGAPMFAAPRSIVINDAPAMPGPDGKPPPPGAAQASSAQAAYAGAVARTASLYATMIAAARSLQADAMAEQERLARTQEGGLLRDLDQLEAGLRGAHGASDLRRHRSILAIRNQAAILRRLIRRTSSAALGRFAALAVRYQAKLSDANQIRTATLGTWATAETERSGALATAITALNAFPATAASRLEGHFGEAGATGSIGAVPSMNDAMVEAAVQFSPLYARADVRDLTRISTDLEANLAPSGACLPCNFDSAAAGVMQRINSLTDAGPKAVRKARKAALQAVDEMEEDLILATMDMHHSLQAQLVDQHDASRRGLIQQAASGVMLQQREARTGGRRNAQVAVSLAQAQGQGLAAAHAELSRPEMARAPAHASAVMGGVQRLMRNLANVASRYPAFLLGQSARAEKARSDAGATSLALRSRAAQSSVEAMNTRVDTQFTQLDRAHEDQLFQSHKLARDIRKICDDIVNPAAAAMERETAKLRSDFEAQQSRVTALLSGTAPVNREEEREEERDGNGEGNGNGGGRSPGRTGTRPPPPPSCGACTAAQAAARTAAPAGAATGTGTGGASSPASGGAGATTSGPTSSGTASSGPTSSGPTSSGPSASGTSSSGATSSGGTSSSAPAANPSTSAGFIAYARQIADDPKRAPRIMGMLQQINRNVPPEIERRAATCNTVLSSTFGPDTAALLTAVRGLSPVSGRAVKEAHAALGHGDLVARLEYKIRSTVFSAGSTDTYNVRAAINALNGNTTEAAIYDLRAAFNYGNEDQRIRDILSSMTPAQLRALMATHGDEINQLIGQLEGNDRLIVDQLLAGNSGALRADRLITGLATPENSSGFARGDAAARALTDNMGAVYALDMHASTDVGVANIFGLDVTSTMTDNDRTAHQAALRNQMLTAFAADARVTRTVSTIDPASATGAARTPEQMLIAYATRDVSHRVWVEDHSAPRGPRSARQMDMDDGRGGGHYETRTDSMNPFHVNWITQIVMHGADSLEAQAASLTVERNRPDGRPDPNNMLAALVSPGNAEPRPGENPDATLARRRNEVMILSEQYQANITRNVSIEPPSAEEARSRVLADMASSYPADADRRSMMTGIVESPQGGLMGAIRQAIRGRNKDLVMSYLGRLNRDQIDQVVTEYDNARLPGDPPLYERLGIFQGERRVSDALTRDAAFDGDDAMRLEIAFMGVPRNPRERAEVALRMMQQQIDASSWAGRGVAASEYAKLVSNRDEMMRLMGVGEAQIDARGRIRTWDPVTGAFLHVGAFDEAGNWEPPEGANVTQFERAIALSRITADNFTEAVDRAANFITTVLVIAAAVVTTVLTGGAAASIWIPMLVTAAAGLVGVAATAALKGGRYGRDAIVRDLAMVLVQTITAGVGAAAGLALRGGSAAVKVAAGRMVMSEAALGLQTGRQLAQMTLRQELMLGAATGALNNVGAAMADPVAWREGRVLSEMGYGALRGAGSGMLGAGAMRLGPVRNLMARDSGWAKGFGRAIGSGLGGGAGRAWDLTVDYGRGTYRGGLSQALDEIGSATIQGAVQGMMEGHGEAYGANSRRIQALQNNRVTLGGETLTVRQWADQPLPALRAALEIEAAARGRPPPTDADLIEHAGALANVVRAAALLDARDAARARAPTRPAGADPAAPPLPGERRAAANDNAPDAQTPIPARHDHGADGTIVARAIETAGDFQLLAKEAQALTDGDSFTVRSADAGNGPITERNLSPAAHAARQAEIALNRTPRSIAEAIAAGDKRPRPIRDSADLTPEMLRQLGPMPEDSHIKALNPHDEAAAERNYHVLRNADTDREVQLVKNMQTGEFMVVQGTYGSARVPGPEWSVVRHSHPLLISDNVTAMLVRSLPSGTGGDLSVFARELNALILASPGKQVELVSTIDTIINGVHSQTVVRLTGPDFSISVKVGHAGIGGEALAGPFRSIAAFEDHAMKITGVDFNAVRRAEAAKARMNAASAPPPAAHEGTVTLANPAARPPAADQPAAPRYADTPDFSDVAADLAHIPVGPHLDALLSAAPVVPPPATHPDLPTSTVDGHDVGSYRVVGGDHVHQVAAMTERPGIGRKSAPHYEDALSVSTKDSRYNDRFGQDVETAANFAAQGRDLPDRWKFISPAGEFRMSRDIGGVTVENPVRIRVEGATEVGVTRGAAPSPWFEDIKSYYKLRAAGIDPHEATALVLQSRARLDDGEMRWMRVPNARTGLGAGSMLSPEFVPPGRLATSTAADDLTVRSIIDGPDDQPTPIIKPVDQAQDSTDPNAMARVQPLSAEEIAAQQKAARDARKLAEATELRVATIARASQSSSESGQSEHFVNAMKAVFDAMPPLSVSGDIATYWGLLIGNVRTTDEAAFMRVLFADGPELRNAALDEARARAIARGATEEEAERLVRRMDLVVAKIGSTFRAHYQHSIVRASIGALPQDTPPTLALWASEHPAVLALVLTNPARARQLFDKAVTLKTPVDSADRFVSYVLSRTDKKSSSLREMIRLLNPVMPSENAVLIATIIAHRERLHFSGPTRLQSTIDASAQPAIMDVGQLRAGQRVLHPEHGMGTVEIVEGGKVLVRYDNEGAAGPPTPEDFTPALWRVPNDPDPLFGNPGLPKNSADAMPFLADLERFRQQAGFPPSGPEGEAGTVAAIFLNGRVFHGTSVDVDRANYALGIDERRMIFDVLLRHFGLKVENDSFQNAQFLGHAEAEAMIHAYLYFGRLPEVLEIYADRTTCNSCSTNLILLARYLGVRQLRIYYKTKSGSTLVTRP